jgi:recombination protein RecA
MANTKTTVIFINQLRHKIGVMFGSPETTPGGLALKFYSSVRLDIRKIETIKQGDVVTGARIRVKVVKNKVAPPYRQAEFEMVNGVGISVEGCVLDMGVETGLIEKAGTWFIYKTERMGQGRENAKVWLKLNPDKYKEIEAELRFRFMNPVPAEKPEGKTAEKADAKTDTKTEPKMAVKTAPAPSREAQPAEQKREKVGRK